MIVEALLAPCLTVPTPVAQVLQHMIWLYGPVVACKYKYNIRIEDIINAQETRIIQD